MLTCVRQTAEELLALVEPAIKDDLRSLSLIDTIVDARRQSLKSLYAYLQLNENHTIPTSLKADNEYMPSALADALLSIVAEETDSILDDRSILWSVAVDFLYSLVESSHVPLGIFHSSHITHQGTAAPEHRASLFRPQKSLLGYFCQVRNHSVQSRWFHMLFQTCHAFRWLLGLIISSFLLSSAEESVRQMGQISTNPSIHFDFTGIEFYSFKEIEERFCQTCITKHRASSQARRAMSGRSVKSARISRTAAKSTRSSRAPSVSQPTAEKSCVSSPREMSKTRAGSTAGSLYQDSILTTADLEYNDNDIRSIKLQLRLALQPSDLSLSLTELLCAMQRRAKKQGYLSMLKSSLQSMMSSAPKEQEWRLPPVTLLSIFEPLCNLCICGVQHPPSDAPGLTCLIMKRLEIHPNEGCTWKARTLNFNSDCDKMLFTISATRYYNMFGEYLYAMDRKLAKFNLAPIMLVPAFYGYRFFIDRALIVEKLGHWNTINLSKLMRTANLDIVQSSDTVLFASSGSKIRINRQVPVEFVFLQLILTVLQRWGELKSALFNNLSEGVERVFIQELEHAIFLYVLTPIENFMRSTIEACPLLQQHIPTLVLLSNAVEALEQRFLVQGTDVKDSILSIRAYTLELIGAQLEIIHGDFQILLEVKYNQVHASCGIKSRTTRIPSLADLSAQPEAYAIGCLFETILSLQLDRHNQKILNPILQEHVNKITSILQEILKVFFEYIDISAQITLGSEVDQLIRQLSECHILQTLMCTGSTPLDTTGQIASTIKLQIKDLFTRLCAALTKKGVTARADQMEYLCSLKRSHMIHKQLLVRLEHIGSG